MIHTPIIQDVLHQYSRWNGTLERAYIKSQQKTAPPISLASLAQMDRQAMPLNEVVRMLLSDGRWRTVAEVASELGIDSTRASRALASLGNHGWAEREWRRVHGKRAQAPGLPQRYRRAAR